tara:strand:- start:352 stop:888 length:537 start_codon:yes stop_codon:yes gene_type:complete
MKSNTETEQLDQEIDKWFEELEAELNKPDVSKMAQAVLNRHSKTDLDRKILDDFHGFAPTINETFNGQLPTITPKAQIFITQNLEEGQYFRFGVAGGGCSGFNYLFDVADKPESDDIQFSETPPALIDETSLKYLYGSEVDLEDSNMNKMLKVINPGAKASCGCGTSFAFDEELLDMY